MRRHTQSLKHTRRDQFRSDRQRKVKRVGAQARRQGTRAAVVAAASREG